MLFTVLFTLFVVVVVVVLGFGVTGFVGTTGKLVSTGVGVVVGVEGEPIVVPEARRGKPISVVEGVAGVAGLAGVAGADGRTEVIPLWLKSKANKKAVLSTDAVAGVGMGFTGLGETG